MSLAESLPLAGMYSYVAAAGDYLIQLTCTTHAQRYNISNHKCALIGFISDSDPYTTCPSRLHMYNDHFAVQLIHTLTGLGTTIISLLHTARNVCTRLVCLQPFWDECMVPGRPAAWPAGVGFQSMLGLLSMCEPCYVVGCRLCILCHRW